MAPPLQIASSCFMTHNFPKEMAISIFSFLSKQDLLVSSVVSHYFRSSIEAHCERACKKEARFLPKGLNYTQLYCKFSDLIGPDFYQEYFGEVDSIPVPKEYIEKARSGFQLLYRPEYITIEVNENVSLVLDEKTAIHGKVARLIRGSRSLERKIKVPGSITNILFLAENCLKKVPRYPFLGLGCAWSALIDQHGDMGGGPSCWSYQKREVIGLKAPYRSKEEKDKKIKGQKEEKGLEIVSLIDRLLFGLTRRIKGEEPPRHSYPERTRTEAYDGNEFHPSVIWFPVSGPGFSLCLYNFSKDHTIGAAVGIPNRKSAQIVPQKSAPKLSSTPGKR